MSRNIESITIGLSVNEVQEAARWYQSLLGKMEAVETAPGAVEFKLCYNVWLQFDDTGYLEAGGDSSVLRLETQDIETDYLAVKAIVDDVDDIEEVEGSLKYFDFKDPYGNRLSFYQLD